MKRRPFENFSGVAAPLAVKDVNTDAIIPAPYLRSADADLAAGLFALWRYDERGAENPDFILNRRGFRSPAVLLCGENFGCGSSREAAAWALVRYGVRAVFAPSFADIFYENAFRNGLLAGIMSSAVLAQMVDLIGVDPERAVVSVDLQAGTLTACSGARASFSVPSFRRDALLRGDDEIAATLRYGHDIEAFVEADRQSRPWIYETGMTP